MKGLIIKDLMCLRKQRVLFIYIVICVFVISIMYVMSANFGNLARAGREMMKDNGLSELDVRNLSNLAIMLFLLLPIAMVGDMSSLFLADGKAGFAKVSASFPIPIEKRVLARYITIVMFLGIGAGVDLLLAVILSLLTDTISFGLLFGMIITGASALMIYGVLLCLYMFLLGYGKESYAQICSIVTMITVVIMTNFQQAKALFLSCFSEDAEVLDVDPIKLIMGFLKEKYMLVFGIAVATLVVSYFLSVVIVKRKRGLV